MPRLILASAILMTAATQSLAEPNHPVAVRWWGQGMVSVETWWGQTVVIDPYNDNIGYTVPDITGDLVLVTHEHSDHNNVAAVGGEPEVVRGLNPDGGSRIILGMLDRPENTAHVVWQEGKYANETSHSIIVRSIPAWHDDESGSKRGAVAMFVIDVDGVRIVHCGDLGQTKLNDMQLRFMGKVDVLCLPVGGVYTIDDKQAVAIIEQVKPRYVIPIHYKTDVLTIGLDPIEPFLTSVGEKYEVDRSTGNTLAVSLAAHPDNGNHARLPARLQAVAGDG